MRFLALSLILVLGTSLQAQQCSNGTCTLSSPETPVLNYFQEVQPVRTMVRSVATPVVQAASAPVRVVVQAQPLRRTARLSARVATAPVRVLKRVFCR